MQLGETFLLEGHIWVVCSMPSPDGSVVIVNFTSWKPRWEDTCVVEAGEHPAITKRSLVAYSLAREIPVAKQQQIDGAPGAFPKCGRVTGNLLTRIQKGALASDMISQRLKDAVRSSVARQPTLPRGA